MTTHLVVLFAGLSCAGIGGELFVRGAVGLADAARIPAGIVGATVAAFATSSPEISVAVSSALSGRPELALGDALGSNVANVGLVLGLALLVGPIRVAGETVRRDLAAALAIPVVTAVLAADGLIGRVDGVILFAIFLVWLVAVVSEARRERSAAPEVLGERSLVRALPVVAIGLVFLIVAGRLIVSGAKGIGADLGLDPFVVGVVFVAVGTSVPELATAVVSRIRGHEEIGLGTVLGSNVFNGALIVPLAAAIAPIEVDWGEIAVSLAFGIGVVVAALPFTGPLIGRRRGALLVAAYGASIATLLLTQA
jgi:cation:H+ antiporter